MKERLTIHTVHGGSDLRQFVGLPYSLYAGDPMWVPQLRREQFGMFDPGHNPFLDHCEYSLLLLKDGRRVIGRIAAFIDRLAADFWQQPIGLFGHYECVDDAAASHLLLHAAADWLKARGMKVMRGPWSFVSQEWGFVLEGFSPPPVIMAPYNPPYYNAHMTAYGLEKVKDLVAYAISGAEGYRIPDRIMHATDIVARRYEVRIRQIDMRRFGDEVQIIMDLSNSTITGNWGYSPVTEGEVKAMARDLKQVIQPKGVLFAEDRAGRPIGFAIAIPDLNVILKKINGRLLPFGWLRLLYELPRLKSYRMFALGVIPEYQGKGIDSLIYRALYESLYTPDIWMEINYVLEDNAPMNNAIRKLGARELRKYRIYERALSEDVVRVEPRQIEDKS